jgi:nucleoid DNA-binding protein
MHKAELIKFISQKRNISITEAKNILEIVLDCISNAIRDNEEIVITGFGKFYKIYAEAKDGVNPKTKEKITIPAYTSVKFSAGKELNELVKNKK